MGGVRIGAYFVALHTWTVVGLEVKPKGREFDFFAYFFTFLFLRINAHLLWTSRSLCQSKKRTVAELTIYPFEGSVERPKLWTGCYYRGVRMFVCFVFCVLCAIQLAEL